MDGVMQFLQGLGAWSLYTLWALVLVAASLLTWLGLGGNVAICALALIWGLATGFSEITWPFLLLLAGMTALGEVIEALLGLVYVAKRGATKHGVTGAFVGGLVGAVGGNGTVPVVGALIGSFIGAFAGAVIGEYIRERNLEPSMRIGWHAFAGKMLAIVVKYAIGVAMVWLILKRTWPGEG